MAENKKLEQEEIQSIMNLRQKMSDKVVQFGEIEVEKHLAEQRIEFLETQKNMLKEEFSQMQESEKKLADDLNAKYGEGNLNLDTGEFIPA
jgi:DNA-binding transcriptional MerR regulator